MLLGVSKYSVKYLFCREILIVGSFTEKNKNEIPIFQKIIHIEYHIHKKLCFLRNMYKIYEHTFFGEFKYA